MSDFLKDIIKTTGNEYAALVSDGVEAGDVENFIDTGSYVFNALLSGSVYGGLPANKITALAGESATGKTYFLMGIVMNFLDANPDMRDVFNNPGSSKAEELEKRTEENKLENQLRLIRERIEEIESSIASL